MAVPRQQRSVRLIERVADRAALHQAPIDEQELLPPRGAVKGRLGDKAMHPQVVRVVVQRQKLLLQTRSENGLDAFAEASCRRLGVQPVVQMQAHVDVLRQQCQAGEALGDVTGLGGGMLEKLQARRGVVEKLTDPNGGARRGAAGFHARQLAAVYPDARRGHVRLASRHQVQARHRRDAGQRLAAEAEGRQVVEIRQGRYLAGRVAREALHRVVVVHADAVVIHLDQLDAALLHRHLDGLRPCIQGVFEQFLDDGSRALDHLAGGYMIDHAIGQRLHPSHDSLRLCCLLEYARLRTRLGAVGVFPRYPACCLACT